MHFLLIGRPTNEFPHPLARVPQNTGHWVCNFVWRLSRTWKFFFTCVNCLADFTNKNVLPPLFIVQLSFIVVELLIWWGRRRCINDFRSKKLKLAPISYFSTYRRSISHLPTTYMWSPHVVPKPKGKIQFLVQITFSRIVFIDLFFGVCLLCLLLLIYKWQLIIIYCLGI